MKMKKAILVGLGTLWIAAIIGSFYFLGRYENEQGTLGKIPTKWPASSEIERSLQKPTLLVFLHPHCPCSKATIGALEFIISRCSQPFEVTAVFFVPENAKKKWANAYLFRSIQEISESLSQSKRQITINTRIDSGGKEAKIFGAAISGTTLLYNMNHTLEFCGGITLSRGHFDSGDNFGINAIVNVINGKKQNTILRTPVFGCPIFEIKGTDVCPNCNQTPH